MSVLIELTQTEVDWYTDWAMRRDVNARQRAKKPKWGQPEENVLRDELIGALTEPVVARYLGHPLKPAPDGWEAPILPRGDNGNDVDGRGVRGTKLEYGSLIIRPEDDDDRVFYLVTYTKAPNIFAIPGCLTGAEGKKLGEYKTYDHRPKAFFVKQKDLRPPE